MNSGLRRIRIDGTGAAVPRHATSSEELDQRLGLEAGTVFRRTGVRARYQSTDETAAALAVAACEAALQRAGLAWEDIDCLVATSATMDQALPFNAALILAEIGPAAKRVAAFDIGASCMSFLVGLDVLSYLVDAGRFRRVMLVSSDISTFSLDWLDLDASAIFGDGAAAVIIRQSAASESSTLKSSRIATLPEGADLCRIRAGGSRYHPHRVSGEFDPFTLFQMEGPRLFRLVARELPAFVKGVLDEAGLALDEIDVVVPHQGSRFAIDHLVRLLRIDRSRLVDIFESFGNQVGASLPFALHHALVERDVQRGDSILLIGSGAGVTLGGAVLVY